MLSRRASTSSAQGMSVERVGPKGEITSFLHQRVQTVCYGAALCTVLKLHIPCKLGLANKRTGQVQPKKQSSTECTVGRTAHAHGQDGGMSAIPEGRMPLAFVQTRRALNNERQRSIKSAKN